MKIIRNKSRTPIRVPLPRGKVLHLGPSQEGKISHNDVDHEPLQRLVEGDVLEIIDDQSAAAATHDEDKGPHANTHGHHPASGSQTRGDR